MEFLTFDDLQAHIQESYQQGDYAGVLELATAETPNFPEQFHLLYYWRICMAARLADNDLALRLLDELLDSGFWYSETLLRQSPSLADLQGKSEFEARIARSLALQELEQEQLFPLLVLRGSERCTEPGDACPLLVGLHANLSTAQASVEFWQAAAETGWLVAIPQSTQAIWKGAYVWDDREKTAEQLDRQLQILRKQYSLDPDRVVIAGHSMGGEMAIWLAVAGLLPVEGFIALGPGGPLIDEVENWTEILNNRRRQELRGYLILGDEDTTIPQENVVLLGEILNQAGIPTGVEEIMAAGHDFAEEYRDALLRGLNYIEE